MLDIQQVQQVPVKYLRQVGTGISHVGTQRNMIVTGGTVVTDSWSGRATVVVREGVVAAVLHPDEPVPDASCSIPVIDAAGSLLLPGGVDPHTHIGMELGEYATRDGYREATEAALWGGTTTVVDFAIPRPGQTPLDAVNERQRAAVDGLCDAALHGCVISWDADVPRQLAAMADLGVRTVKVFTTYRDVVMASADTVIRVMTAMRELGGLIYVHAEANHIVESDQGEAARSGRINAANHARTRSELAELTAVQEVLAAARQVDAAVYFVHQTIPEAIHEVRRARETGVAAYTETCPHYLTLDDEMYAGEYPERYVCCPPLRTRASVDAVASRVMNGQVEAIGSDHCCYSIAQKRENRADVRVMPNGLPGVETRLPVTFTELVKRRGLPVERLVALLATNPARLNGLYPRKGTIAPGSDADLIIVDPKVAKVVTAKTLHMATDYSPYEGRTLWGWPHTVIQRGAVVLQGGILETERCQSRCVPSQPIPNRQLAC